MERKQTKMVGVGRGVKVPAEHKEEYVAARKRLEDAQKLESKLWNRGNPKEGYDDAVKEQERAVANVQGVVDKIRKTINPPPPEPKKEESAFVQQKRAASASNATMQAKRDRLPMYTPHAPGWDAKAKSDLRNASAEKEFEPKVHRFTKAEADEILGANGW